MEKKRYILLIVALIALLNVGAMVWLLQVRNTYSAFMKDLFTQRLSRVEFQPGFDFEGVQTNDPEFLDELASWLPKLREPDPSYSLKEFSFPLVLVFENGHREELKFSGAPGLYVLVYWRHRRFWGGGDPFTEFLKKPQGARLLKPRAK